MLLLVILYLVVVIVLSIIVSMEDITPRAVIAALHSSRLLASFASTPARHLSRSFDTHSFFLIICLVGFGFGFGFSFSFGFFFFIFIITELPS